MITSGIGYVVWYSVLPHLSVVNAATIQLSVPAIAAVMGVVVLGESFSLRLVAATVAIVLGIASVLHFRAADLQSPDAQGSESKTEEQP